MPASTWKLAPARSLAIVDYCCRSLSLNKFYPAVGAFLFSIILDPTFFGILDFYRFHPFSQNSVYFCLSPPQGLEQCAVLLHGLGPESVQLLET